MMRPDVARHRPPAIISHSQVTALARPSQDHSHYRRQNGRYARLPPQKPIEAVGIPIRRSGVPSGDGTGPVEQGPGKVGYAV
jgi:hypothetical protein